MGNRLPVIIAYTQGLRRMGWWGSNKCTQAMTSARERW